VLLVKESSVFSASSRVIDVGITDLTTMLDLAARGCHRYLGLVEPERLAVLRAEAGAFADRLQPIRALSDPGRCDTDVLILRGTHVRALWHPVDLARVRYVVSPASHGRAQYEGRIARHLAERSGWLRGCTTESLGAKRLQVSRVSRAAAVRPRRYYSPVWGPAGLLGRLSSASIRYVVLRWFEDLPEVDEGEDLDILVADEDLAAVEALLGEDSGTRPLDLYTESGLPGTDYQSVSYYPPGLARQILDSATCHRSGALVPAPELHLLSLAYHAVYHKGFRSGLPSVLGDPSGEPEHDYRTAITAIAGGLGVDVGSTLEDLDEFLASSGWRPPEDALARMAASNPWIARRWESEPVAVADGPELAVFLLRERAATVLPLDDVLGELVHLGFEPVLVQQLDPEARRRCTEQLRGGNWGRGPWQVSGGGPAVLVAAVHYAPQPVSRQQQERYPRLTNADFLAAKLRIRALVQERVAQGEAFNPIHSADNEGEAWHYLALAAPDDVPGVRDELVARRQAFRTDHPVVRVVSQGRRAKVEMVSTSSGTVLRKTFSVGAQRHLDREVAAMRELAPAVPAVPPLLEVGHNWFTRQAFDDDLPRLSAGGRLLPLDVVRQMVAVLRQIHDLGYDLVDAKPGNFLLDPQHGLKIVDLEFLYPYTGPRPPLRSSHGFVGLPRDFSGDSPVSDFSFDWRWRRFTGLRLDTMLDAPRRRQRLERLAYRTRRATTGPRSPLRVAVRAARSRLADHRRRAVRAYRKWARRRARFTGSAPA
jgi:hypothetical protein